MPGGPAASPVTTSTEDDRELTALLAASGVERTVDEVRDIVAGAAAAPQGFFPDAWLDLIAPPEAAELRAQLRRRKAALAAARPVEPPVAARLAALRGALAQQGVDGFVLPLTEENRR